MNQKTCQLTDVQNSIEKVLIWHLRIFFAVITNWSGGGLQIEECATAHTAKLVWVVLTTNWGLLHSPCTVWTSALPLPSMDFCTPPAQCGLLHSPCTVRTSALPLPSVYSYKGVWTYSKLSNQVLKCLTNRIILIYKIIFKKK